MVGLVPELVKLVCSSWFRIFLLLARLYCFGRLFNDLLSFLLSFIFLFDLIFSFQGRTRFAVLRTRDRDAFGFERLFNLRQLLDESCELFDVEGDSLRKKRISMISTWRSKRSR